MSSITRLSLACAVLCATSASAQQQQFRPRILVVFDTSGSMSVDLATGEPTGGDNSAEYPGDGNTSRLFVAKNAMSALVETTSEVDFALMRYPQREGDGINRGILDGFQQNLYAGLEENPLNYGGSCRGELRPAMADDFYSLIVPFGLDNESEIVAWLDHHENWPLDPELRADGPTPIAESLRIAETYFREVVADDPGVRCRQNAVLLLTDGGESCVLRDERQDTLRARAAALRNLEVEVDGEQVGVDVKTYVVTFAVGRKEELVALAREGGGVDPLVGEPYSASNQADLRAAFAQILRDAIPVEDCNGRDDDCDGEIDEGVLNSCGVCGADPVEACNGADEDCDGRIDEGALNACGECGETPEEVCNTLDDDCDGAVDENLGPGCQCAGVMAEDCNGVDDDCDGHIDNAPGTEDPLFRPCGRDTGECTVGRELCADGEWGACDGVAPGDEACDGLDNDCDGVPDEAVLPCGPAAEAGLGDVGECKVGARRCDLAACDADPALCGEDAFLLECEDAVGPTDEVCDGRDNNCDGEADEGLFNACGFCGPNPPEACNNEDDNCDGRIDEDARCPPGHLCFAGECVQPCDASGECRGGFQCVPVYAPNGRFCHPNPCAGARCPEGTACVIEARTCVDLCAEADCGEDEGCDLGECVPATCRHTGCPDGQVCFGDACLADACAGVECDEGEFCREGECVAACAGQSCGEGSRCLDGECVPDPCGGRCLLGQLCDESDGVCVVDPCLSVYCPPGMACGGEGECTADDPCVAIRCPTGTTCRDGSCTDHTPGVYPDINERPPRPDFGVGDGGVPDANVNDGEVIDPITDAAPTPDMGGGGGGGDPGPCECDAVGGGGELPWSLWMLLAVVRTRRRRW